MDNEMNWQVSAEERGYLRGLAQKQSDYAASDVMRQRKQMWFDLNDGRMGGRPPVVIETWTFAGDFLPESVFHCTSKTGREIERRLLENIRNYELINDDKVMPDTFDIAWFIDIDQFGPNIKIGQEVAKDAEGRETGCHYIHPITDLERDIHLLKPPTCRVDRERTFAWRAFLDDLFGDLLPVRIRGGTYGNTMLTQKVIQLMGMEPFFMALYDTPDAVHQLMAYLRDNVLSIMRWVEAEGLLSVNNENQTSFGSSYNFTTRLAASGSAQLSDMWGASNSQETVGISPEQFREFCAPYYRTVCEPFGLLYYGCCEPAHPFWEDIRQMPHLKKVSINRWTDQQFMGEALRGSDIVFSRKPDPNFLGVDVSLKEDAWSAHIGETLDATRGVFTEIIVRDVYTVHGNLNKVRRAVELACKEIDKRFS
ncbi:MAG: hypothetical protein WCS31_08215 [Verrucomicrobiae bacterium]